MTRLAIVDDNTFLQKTIQDKLAFFDDVSIKFKADERIGITGKIRKKPQPRFDSDGYRNAENERYRSHGNHQKPLSANQNHHAAPFSITMKIFFIPLRRVLTATCSKKSIRRNFIMPLRKL